MSTEKNEEQERKNGSFVQYDENNLTLVRELMRINPVAADIFMFISQKMNRKNALACPSKVFEEVTGKSRQTVSRAIQLLKKKHFVSILKMGTTNVYVLNPSIVWKAWRTGKQYCEFEGTMIIAKSENEHIEKELKSKNYPLLIK